MARIFNRTSGNDYVGRFQHRQRTKSNGRVAVCSTFIDNVATIPPLGGNQLIVFHAYWYENIPSKNVITVRGIPEKTQTTASICLRTEVV
jgi:hypothetical protein